MSKIGAYLRRKQHYNYVEDSVLELANKIYQEACLHGTVDVRTRQLLLKYQQKLKTLADVKG